MRCKDFPQLTKKKMHGRLLVFSALVGSHNYNLNTEESDEDYKYFVLPTFSDLYRNKKVTASEVSPELDYGLHDIRHLAYCVWKANINFVEPLFSIKQDYSPESLVMWMLAKREELARMNLPGMYESCVGMSKTREIQARKGNKAGKNLSHAIRCLDFLIRYEKTGFTDYRSAIWYEPDQAMGTYLKELKRREPTPSDYYALEDLYEEVRQNIRSSYQRPSDDGLYECFQGQVYDLVRKQIVFESCEKIG